jgi:hypothetical protein
MATQKEINSSDNLLHYAILDNKTEFVIEVISIFENDLNVQNIDNNTPLHYACLRGNLKVVKLLHNKNADMTIKNKQGLTPLMTAIHNQHYFVVHYLLSLEQIMSIDKLAHLIKIFQFTISSQSIEIFSLVEKIYLQQVQRYEQQLFHKDGLHS